VQPAGGADAEWARAARAGDRDAFARLYERFAPVVHGVLLCHASETDVRDLVQDVFLSALRSIRVLEEPERVGAWLLSIARNRARDASRRAGTRSELRLAGDDDTEIAVDRSPSPNRAGDDDAAEARRALAAIRALPEAYRETLTLRLVEGLSGPDIAERTGLTPGSVRVNLHRGMKLLRERLQPGGAA